MCELIETNARLAEINQEKTRFVAEVSHELRTALHSLTLYVHLLEKGESDRQKHYQTMLRHSIEHLAGFVEDTLSLSQLELNQPREQTMAATDLNAVINCVLNMQRARVESAGLELRIDLAENLPPVLGDFRLLQQVITNLLVNAVKYTPAGYVALTTYAVTGHDGAAGETVALEVTDSGRGITEEDLPHIFDRFYRGRAQQWTGIGGTGLGLAIVREIVTQHQGQIAVESRLEGGTRFIVHLPQAGHNGHYRPLAAFL